MEGIEQGRKSIAQFRKSIYGGDEVEFADIFQYDMDDEDHEKILSVMRRSLNRLPPNLKDSLVEKFVETYPEIDWTKHKDAESDEEIEAVKEMDDFSMYSYGNFLPARWNEIHDSFTKNIRNFSSTFTLRDAERFWYEVQQRKETNYITSRMNAIEKLANDVNNSLYMIYKTNLCRGEDFKLDDYEHFHVFGWTDDRFFARRQMRGIAWVDIFTKSLTVECLEAFKLRYDIMELVRLLKPLLLSFCTVNDDYIKESKGIIDNANDLLTVHDRIAQELEKNVTYFCEKINQLTNISLQRRSVGRDVVKNYLEMEQLAFVVRDPIEQRYHVNYLKHKADDWQQYCDKQEDDIEQNLRKILFKHKTEEYCSLSMVQCIYAIIEDYKSRIDAMSEEYERRFSELDDKNRKLKLDIDKIKLQREFLAAEKVYMQQRIKEIAERPGSRHKSLRRKRSQLSIISTRSKRKTKMNLNNI
ncbi:uncharacterized protein LOC101460846 [Ceratitis capitata]|uniref:(Mediterranean fruit fly) hypothetical protein n=1 Tax=Ceratitis capitata TaxID=7213 RepID=A0A811UL08_CERCA|nr:uncharacterized protein LOC101460846 [Ceratitis capitata]CAD6999484.1 unnamed protein product [Ceratitis capitata]